MVKRALPPTPPPCRCGMPLDLMGTRAHREMHALIARATVQADRARSCTEREGWRTLRQLLTRHA
jgi:hypothetical protein